ncbi:MAG: alpha/beta hydrolase [Thermodesulfobacteriota bacterium]
MEQKISIECGDLLLSGLFDEGHDKKGVVITHPHPLYGGNMYNPVVETIARAYRAMGYATLRFDFRGTGASTGQFDDGEGEQEDVAAAFLWLLSRGMDQVDLSGYSFGAWVIARCVPRLDVAGNVILVAPPVNFVSFDDVGPIPRLAGVVTGEMDELAPPDRIAALLPAWNKTARLSVIEGADHFFWGCDRELQERLEEMIV